MTRVQAIADLAERMLGRAVRSTAPLAGGDVCACTRIRLSSGASAVVKTRPQAPLGFFEAEAHGLGLLAEADAVVVPRVLAVGPEALILDWIEPSRATPEQAATLGRGLAGLHRYSPASFGHPNPGFIGTLPVPAQTFEDWAHAYAATRLLPFVRLASDRDRLDPDDCAAIEQVIGRLDQLGGPPEPPARLHGDLWAGNVVWSERGPAVLDPSTYGGHRETDLAMLALFGLPHLERVLAAYDEAHPLADGWRERQPLHQLSPLLVHAVMFGGGYGAAAGAAARRMLARSGPR